jgi:uncharacterized repeat protein (TIGR01451 family)
VTDDNPGNNSATDTDTINVIQGADVSGTKTVAGNFVEGGSITYTIVLTNNGAGAQGDNPGDEFTDTLPPQVTLVSAAATSGTATTAGNTVFWNGALPAAGSVTLTVQATINAGTAGQTISNQGTIAFDGDGNGTNESTAPTDDPTPPGATDPTDFFVTGVVIQEIPTLTGVGFAALALILGAAALVALRRRRAA